MPIYEIDILSHTYPPIKAPEPIPRLNIPENIDIDTAVVPSGETLIISDCIDTLYAVCVIPHITQRTMVTGILADAGSKSISAAAQHASTMFIKRNLSFV